MNFIWGPANHNNFSVIFEDTASKREKIGPMFSSFNPFPSLPFISPISTKI